MLLKYLLSISAFFCFATAALSQGVITTVAGTGWLFPGNGGPAVNAPLSETYGLDLAVDAKGNYYICDAGNLMVMRVGTDGIVNVVAGNGFGFVSGNGGLAVNAGLLSPIAVAVDGAGDVFISEFAADIRKVTPDGVINTIAGITGVPGFGGDNGPAVNAQLSQPYGLAVDSAGNLYVADTANNRIRKIDPSGQITTIAGTGQPGFSGDSGPAISAQLNQPMRMALDAAGDLYFVDFANFRVREITANGTITTVAGGGHFNGDGVVPTAAALIPLAVAVDATGTLYIVNSLSYGILDVNAQGKLQTIAGGSGKPGFDGDGGSALSAHFQFGFYPSLAIDSAGNILVADEDNGRIRKIATNGIVNTIAGNGLFRFSGDGGPATSATLYLPVSVVEDSSGNILFTEPGVERIRRVAPNGTISVYAGNGTEGYSGDGGPAISAELGDPNYLALAANGDLYFTDNFNCVVRYINTSGVIGTYAGNGACGNAGDGGPALEASLEGLAGLDFDNAGDLIVSESFDHRIRMVSSSGVVSTLAGNGTAGFSGDGGSSQNALVNDPLGVRVYNGSVYFADSGNNRIRSINLATSIITTVAGNGVAAYSGDGGPATQASLNHPASVAFDAAGNMYIADYSNLVVRKVTPGSIISTFAGSSMPTGFDGVLATNTLLLGTDDIFVDSSGNLLLTDIVLGRVREVLNSVPSFQVNPTSLAFTAPAGSTPVSQSVSIAGSIPGIPFTASATSNGNWLQLSISNGTMPASLGITANPSALPAGANQGTITINAPNATPLTQTISVALTTTAAGQPSLNANPSALTFAFVQQSAANAQTISISNVGGGSLSFSVTASTTSGGSWLSASPSNGTVNGYSATAVAITANPASLAPGAYSGTVVISSSNPAQSVLVPVTMTVSAVLQTILIPQTGLTFFAVQGGGPAPPQYFSILNTGVGQMTFNISGGTLSGGAWLSAFPLSGESDASSSIVPQVEVGVNPGSLTAGIYYALLKVTSPGADNSPQSVSIILNVLPPGSNIGPLVEPTGLIFSAVAGGGLPGSQTVLVQNTSSNPLIFRSGQITNNGPGWFTSNPQNATVTQAQPVNVVIQPQTSGLAAGVYRGSLTLSFSDGSTRNIALLLVLLPANSAAPSAEARATTGGGCTPTMLAPIFTLLQDGFSIPAGFPGQVAVSVIDDCAHPMTSGNVTVGFSNGDPAIGLISLKDGTWAGTWTPVHNTPQVVVTATAQIPEQNLQGQVQIKGGFQTYTQPPVIGTGAIVNGASFAAQTPVAPGSFITLFGTNLAQGQNLASSVPLPVNLSGSSILLAGQSAPLLFANDGQVNAIVPYGIAVNSPQQVVVSRSSSLSVPQSIILAAAAPGIFTVNATGQGQGIIVGVDANGNQSIADTSHPVTAGEAIVIYCTGLGEVNPPVPTGTAAPMSPLSPTVEPIGVSVGGVASNVFFSGLTPGFVGLYQVNATVPNGVTPGSQVPVTLTGAGQTSMPVTIAVQ